MPWTKIDPNARAATEPAVRITKTGGFFFNRAAAQMLPPVDGRTDHGPAIEVYADEESNLIGLKVGKYHKNALATKLRQNKQGLTHFSAGGVFRAFAKDQIIGKSYSLAENDDMLVLDLQHPIKDGRRATAQV